MTRANAPIMIVEDNEDDLLLIHRAIKKARFSNPICNLRDGEQAIAYLSGQGRYADRQASPLPSLILLDLKLPRRDGFEVLSWLKEQPVICRIPIIVLTSSRESLDVDRAYDYGANSYLVKPIEFRDLLTMIQTIQSFWLELNEPPKLDVLAIS